MRIVFLVLLLLVCSQVDAQILRSRNVIVERSVVVERSRSFVPRERDFARSRSVNVQVGRGFDRFSGGRSVQVLVQPSFGILPQVQVFSGFSVVPQCQSSLFFQ